MPKGQVTYICPLCGHTLNVNYGAKMSCPNISCTEGIDSKKEQVISRFEPQIRKVVDLGPSETITLQHYHDRFILQATLDKLAGSTLMDIPYDFSK